MLQEEELIRVTEEGKKLAWKMPPLSKRRDPSETGNGRNGAEPGRSRTRIVHKGLSSFTNWAQVDAGHGKQC